MFGSKASRPGEGGASRGERPLIVISVSQGYGGAERYLETLLPRLLERRKVVVIAFNPTHLLTLETIRTPGLEVHRIDVTKPGFARRGAWLLVWLCLRHGPGAVVANTQDSQRILAHAVRLLPELDALSTIFVHDFLWRDRDSLLSHLSRATLMVPEIGVLGRPDYIGRIAAPEGRLRAVVVPNPVELPPDTPKDGRATAIFLHLATVTRIKGHVHLADAAAIVGTVAPEVRIESFGHQPFPDFLAEIEGHMAAVGARPTLSLHDHVDDPASLMKRARAVLITTVSEFGGPETFGRTIIEAWVEGRPVIAFACGAPARLIRHGVDGLLVDEKDSRGLAEAIAALHRDPDLADRLGRNGYRRCVEEFSADAVLRQFLSVVDGGRCERGAPRPIAQEASPDSAEVPAILLDLSLSLAAGWRPLSGLALAEQALAAELAEMPDQRVILVCRDPRDGAIRRLLAAELERLTGRGGEMALLAARQLSCIPDPLPTGAGSRPRHPRAFLLQDFAKALGRRLGRRARASHPAGDDSVAGSTSPRSAGLPMRAGDSFVSVADVWDQASATAIRAMREAGVRVVLAVRDLPLHQAPRQASGQGAHIDGAELLEGLAAADRLICLGAATRADVLAACAGSAGDVPTVEVARASGLVVRPNTAGSPPPALDPSRPFVLLPANADTRVALPMLIGLWDEMAPTLPEGRRPVLVAFGRGEGIVEAVCPAGAARGFPLLLLPDVDDPTLVWLYRKARFTLYPSSRNAVGFPAVESLAAGTPVVITDRPALVEATDGLMPSLDLADLPAWRGEITRLCLDDDHLAMLRARASGFVQPRPDQLAKALLAAARGT